ncbi:phosphoadenylyl-sulfate reductase [Curvibacter sp. CHRR-16]|uniref:phosphoadenylyl-sulfate reductase n=1 Tax=Curvibacter sp. CHRR-16 TaxID=2835872 RepID=UPI001BD9F982|nr:phosphoadenylyl-sulfate reductase [Curvibacter sp. CHRR-16]MBT0571017.1 phosphoadenylyl-sulfate reductase [Curvibacter sp. CHRR-16]
MTASRWAPEPQPAGSAILRNANPSRDYALKLQETENLLNQASAQYVGESGESRITLACSLGAEDMVLAHIISRLRLPIRLFVLQTGRLHAETLELLTQLQAQRQAAGLSTVEVYEPNERAAADFVAREGEDAMYQSIALRKECCHIRKMVPLQQALSGNDAWITGLRREQSGARAEVPLIDTSEARSKLNPLAAWTWGDVWHYIRDNSVAYNPLHDQFFPSIGCEPCTRAISLGEDFRAGRWWWEDEAAKECGLHVKS